jgi:hypothetical protein
MSFGDRLGLAGLVMALVAIAVSILWPSKKWIGWLSLSVAVILMLSWGWTEGKSYALGWYRSDPIISTFVIFLCGGLLVSGTWVMLLKESTPERVNGTSPPPSPPATPSLVFVFGAPLGDNDSASWVMMLRHYGPGTAYNCDIGFFDDDRKNIEHQWLVEHPDSPFPPPGLAGGESQKHIQVAEAGLEGAPGNFIWNPLNPNSQHYAVSISCRDGVFAEKWEVTRVDGILRSTITIEHGPQWIKKNPSLDPVVFRCEDPEFIRTSLATELPKSGTGKVVHPGWKPKHRFEVPAAIIDPNGNVQVLSGVKLPDGSTLTDFGCWNILTRHFGDNQDQARQP